MKTASLLTVALVALLGMTPQAPVANAGAPLAPIMATYLQGKTKTDFNIAMVTNEVMSNCDKKIKRRFDDCINGAGHYSYMPDYVLAYALCFDATCNAAAPAPPSA